VSELEVESSRPIYPTMQRLSRRHLECFGWRRRRR